MQKKSPLHVTFHYMRKCNILQVHYSDWESNDTSAKTITFKCYRFIVLIDLRKPISTQPLLMYSWFYLAPTNVLMILQTFYEIDLRNKIYYTRLPIS